MKNIYFLFMFLCFLFVKNKGFSEPWFPPEIRYTWEQKELERIKAEEKQKKEEEKRKKEEENKKKEEDKKKGK